jgi:hypothetical protein
MRDMSLGYPQPQVGARGQKAGFGIESGKRIATCSGRSMKPAFRLLAFVALMWSAGANAGEHNQVFDLTEKGFAQLTWAEALKQIFPDMALAPTPAAEPKARPTFVAHKVVEMRPIDGEPFADTDCDGEAIEYLDVTVISFTGLTRTLVGVNMDRQCAAPLALFDSAGKLLDVVNAQKDMTTGYSENFGVRLSDETALVQVDNYHTGAGSGGDMATLVMATPNKLSTIASFGGQYETICDDSKHVFKGFDTGLTATVAPDYGDQNRIIAYVKTRSMIYKDDCRTVRGTPVVTVFETMWRWNAAKHAYVSSGAHAVPR